MSEESEAREANSKATMWLIPIFLVFAVLATNVNSTYLSISLYDSLPQIVLIGLLVCGGPWFGYFIWRYWTRRNTKPMQIRGKNFGPFSALWYAIFLGLVLGFLEMALLGIVGFSIVRATASTRVQFNAPISLHKGHGGRSCRYDLSFYNRPVGRDVRLCGENWEIPGAKNGDTLLVKVDVGPFGAHLESLQRLPQ